MKFQSNIKQSLARFGLVLMLMCLLQGCFERWSVDLQWDSENQILRSEDSQVELRSIQTHVFDTTNRITLLQEIVGIMQDLSFEIDEMDEELGIVSGKKWITQLNSNINDPGYYSYQTDQLMLFNTNYRSWQPFYHRKDMTRMTVTVRPKKTTRSLVRVNIQYNLKPLEDAEVYQAFFKTLKQSLLTSAEKDKFQTQDDIIRLH